MTRRCRTVGFFHCFDFQRAEARAKITCLAWCVQALGIYLSFGMTDCPYSSTVTWTSSVPGIRTGKLSGKEQEMVNSRTSDGGSVAFAFGTIAFFSSPGESLEEGDK